MNKCWIAKRAFSITAILCVTVTPFESSATVLTYVGTSGPIAQAYGDRVTSTMMGSFGYGQFGEGFTSRVTVDYDPAGGDPRTWPGAYGDLPGPVLYESDDSAKLQIRFTADPGYHVQLLGWDMATYGQIFHPEGETIDSVTVYDAAGAQLFSQTNVFVPISTHITFNTFPSPLIDSMLTLEIDARNVTEAFGNADIGVDNIRFRQAFASPPAVTGDYNQDGSVNAADYVVWRNQLGADVVKYFGADGNGDGIVNHGDYAVWKSSYGDSGGSAFQAEGVPEPSAVVLLGMMGCLLLVRARSSQKE